MIFISCGTNEIVEESITLISVVETTTATSMVTLEEYERGWIEKLETYPVLTKDEFDKSIEFLLLYRNLNKNLPSTELAIIVDGNNYVCERRTTGTVISSYSNERHPLSLYISETGDNVNVDELTIYEYIVTGDYNCSLENSEEGLFLWGPLFFQDNQWWGFIEYEDEYFEQSGEPDILIRSFAKRVSLGSSINYSQISNNNFLNAWKKLLKDELILDSNEIALTKELEELMTWKGDKYNLDQYLYEIEVNNLTCTRLYNSMGWALFDQIHPIEKDFRSSHTYKCDESGDFYLFGSPFYYQGNWWIFHNIEVDFSTLDCETPCGISAQFFASKFKIDYPKDLLNN